MSYIEFAQQHLVLPLIAYWHSLYISDDQLFFLFGVSLFALLACGFSNKVVVYFDKLDLFSSAGIIVIPTLCYMFVVGSLPEGAADFEKTIHYENYRFVITVTGIASAFLCLTTLVSSIKHNGFMLGPPIWLLKILVASAFLVLVFLLIFGGDEENKKRRRPFYQTLFIIGAIGWLMSKLINGEAVLKARKLKKSAT